MAAGAPGPAVRPRVRLSPAPPLRRSSLRPLPSSPLAQWWLQASGGSGPAQPAGRISRPESASIHCLERRILPYMTKPFEQALDVARRLPSAPPAQFLRAPPQPAGGDAPPALA